MANKTKSGKTMDDYKKESAKKNKGARIMAIVMIFLMVVFTFLTAGMFLLD